jgi:hypothetical protein
MIGLHPSVLTVEGTGNINVSVDYLMSLSMEEKHHMLLLLDAVYEAGYNNIKPEARGPQPEASAVNPDHYKVGGIECIDYLKAKLSAEEFRGFLKGNAVKYLSRAEHKGNAEDYAKANWYTNMLAGKDPRN